MDYFVVCLVALIASALTFFSGFGLGTLLLPAFAVFFPVERAVALTAIVHFLNGIFKLALVWRHVDWRIVLRFGLLAIVGALAGAWSLLLLAEAPPLWRYALFGHIWEVQPVKLLIGLLLLVFACAEMLPGFRNVSISPRYLPIGGLLSGYFGGLAGMQGALRSAFLVKAGLTKERYVATGAAVAFLIDVSRLSIYAQILLRHRAELDYGILAAAVFCAFAGATFGSYLLSKTTMAAIQKLVAVLLLLVALGLMAGML
jgi:uncharacterized membrane protein YfcA